MYLESREQLWNMLFLGKGTSGFVRPLMSGLSVIRRKAKTLTIVFAYVITSFRSGKPDKIKFVLKCEDENFKF